MRRFRWMSVLVAVAMLAPTSVLAGKKQCLSAMDTHLTLGTAYLNEGACEAALSEFLLAEGGCRAAARDPEIQHRIGLAYFCNESLQEAEGRLKRSVELSKTPTGATLVNLSALYIAQERWAEAEQTAELALTDPTYLEASRARHNIAYAAMKQGKLEVAEARWQEVLKANPEFCPAWQGLSEAAAARNDPDAAGSYSETAATCREP